MKREAAESFHASIVLSAGPFRELMQQALTADLTTSRSFQTLLRIGLAALLLLMAAVLAFAVLQPIQVLPRMRLAPGFILTTAEGARLTNEDLRGSIVLYNFSYTRCPEPCYGMHATMQEVSAQVQALNTAGLPFRQVTISFDPAYDTPERLAAYAAQAGAGSDWTFAAPSDPALMKEIIGRGFETFYEDRGDGDYAFNPNFVLVDGWGIIRGQYRYTTLTPDSDRIVRHIGVLFEEIENSVGAARLVYEAAHLFLCYAP